MNIVLITYADLTHTHTHTLYVYIFFFFLYLTKCFSSDINENCCISVLSNIIHQVQCDVLVKFFLTLINFCVRIKILNITAIDYYREDLTQLGLNSQEASFSIIFIVYFPSKATSGIVILANLTQRRLRS